MRELILMRHAEAAPLPLGGTDYARPLTAGGAQAATAAALRILQQHGAPDCVLHSPAVRTTATAAAVCIAMRLDAASLRADARLYLASPDALLQALAKIPDAAHRVLLVAHNPAVSELAAALGTNARSRALATAEFRHFALPVEQWRELRESS